MLYSLCQLVQPIPGEMDMIGGWSCDEDAVRYRRPKGCYYRMQDDVEIEGTC